MTNVLHLIDAACDETCLQVLAGLADRLNDGDHRHATCALDGAAAGRAARWMSPPVDVAPLRLRGAAHWSPGLTEVARRRKAEVVHAWGVEAAAAAALCLPDRPLLLTLLDPRISTEAARWLVSLPVKMAVIAGNQVVNVRLARHGVDPARIAVIRSEVDFKAISAARGAGVRQGLVGDDAPVLLLPSTPATGGEAYSALWGAAVIRQIHPRLRLILPYAPESSDAPSRAAAQFGMREMVCRPSPDLAWPDLVASADIMFAPVSDDICTEPLAWAMAAGVPIVASAVRSIAEYIADHHNGLLFKPGDHKSMARRLLSAIEDADQVRRLGEVARGQAYEVFSRRVFAENYGQAYRNLLTGTPINEGLRDTVFFT